MSCDFKGRCLNSGEYCYRCTDLSSLKLPQDKTIEQRRRKTSKLKASSSLRKQPSWKGLEAATAAISSAVPDSIEMESRIRPGSGNQPGHPGDNLDDVLFIEDKERKANELIGGEKSISIKKGWLDKAIEEAQGSGKFPVVPFRYKGTEDIYCFTKYQTLAELVHEIKYLRTELHIARKMLQVGRKE